MMKAYSRMTPAEREREYESLQETYQALQARKLSLNMARGKPGKEQLDLVSGIFQRMLTPEEYFSDGEDVRNYGSLAGLPAARRLFADILGCKPEQVFVGGNASLQLMYDTITKAYTHGLLHSERPWHKEGMLRWLCPVPGYDRHFRITADFGFEMILIPMTETGPDMDMVENAVKDPSVKGIWCVPKYSNPDGIVYSEETIRRLASLHPAAPDFVIMWDNAYCVHEFDGDYVPFPDMLSVCAECGNPDIVVEFASTSKITLPGAGVSCFACSEDNMAYLKRLLSVQAISFDKVNQQRHVLYLRNREHTLELMKHHAEILRPKFQCVLEMLEQEIAPLGIAAWNRPKGGYFISLNAMPGTARRTLKLCRNAGVTMTPAGATFPYGLDPNDSNIRIAPTYPSLEELKQAGEIFCVCLRLAALEQLRSGPRAGSQQNLPDDPALYDREQKATQKAVKKSPDKAQPLNPSADTPGKTGQNR